jgi:hypothetical protein
VPIDPPESGDTITTSSITSMFDTLRATVNAMNSGNIERHALGPQHLPTIVVGHDYKEVTTLEFFDAENDGDRIDEETSLELSTMKLLSSYTLDNGGAGYTLPPCKVLVWFNCRCQNFEGTPIQPDQQGWLAVGFSVNGIENWKLMNSGMIQASERVLPDHGVDLVAGIEEPFAICFVIDEVNIGGNWTLDFIKVRGAGSRGGYAGANRPEDFEIPHGVIGFIAFYVDE